MDHEAYLKRLEYDGPLEPGSANTLAALHQRHLYSVPFENLDISMGTPIGLEANHLTEKIIDRRRGGFCYELNGLFALLLERLGYAVRRLNARVASDTDGFGIPFDHLCLLVSTTDGEFLADVGFGESFRRPIPFALGALTSQDGTDYRLSAHDDGVLLSSRPPRAEDGSSEAVAFAPRYLFSTENYRLEDFGHACSFHQHSPESPFTQKTLITIARPDGRLTLSDRGRIETADRGRKRRESTIASGADYVSTLIADFGFTSDEADRCQMVFDSEASRRPVRKD